MLKYLTERDPIGEEDHQLVWPEDEDDYLDALDVEPACPRCGSPVYEHDSEFQAHICNDCGLWVEDEDDE